MIIHTQGEYTVKYIGKTPVPASVIINGKETATGASHGFVFNLYKGDTFLKTHSVAAKFPTPAQETIDFVINVFKKYMV